MKREIKFRAWDKKRKCFLSIFPYQFQDGVYRNGTPNRTVKNTFELTDDGVECNRVDGKSVFLTIDGNVVGVLPSTQNETISIDYSNEYELMQFTGLKDKNGKEIYEGDILAIKFFPAYVERISWEGYPDAIAEIFWDLSGFRLHAKGGKDLRYADFCDINYDETEIIGNIYKNPELLK